MTTQTKKDLCWCLLWFVLFFALTAALCVVDVQPAGPQNSLIGLAGINTAFHTWTGQTGLLDKLTDIPLYLAFLECAFFAGLGLVQLIRGKSLRKVDPSIYALAAIYILMAVLYVAFEHVVINMRPVLENGILEPSYPSSHTMMVVTIYGTGIVAFHTLFPKNKALSFWIPVASFALIAFAVCGRLLCGVHWLTDIAGGLLLGCALVWLYKVFVDVFH